MDTSSGTMIRAARRRARMSQTDLARRAGVAQSVISAYESDRREPGLRTLAKLIEATGHQLAFELIPAPRNRFGLPDTRLGRRLRRHRRAVIEIAARRGARKVRVFGSVARGEDTDTSDIDLLVDLDVDVVPGATLKSAVRDEILAEAIAL